MPEFPKGMTLIVSDELEPSHMHKDAAHVGYFTSEPIAVFKSLPLNPFEPPQTNPDNPSR